MADEKVRAAQRWVNAAYKNVPGYREIPEDGVPGLVTLHALIRGLQHELGITDLSDNFGQATLSALAEKWPVIDGGHGPENVIRIVQSGLYCKGYPGGGISGSYEGETADSVRKMKTDMGVENAFGGDGVEPKVFKGLLTTDSYERIAGGTDEVRAVQRWLNGTYVNRRDFFIGPCDGHSSRETLRALILGVQFEIGLDDDAANGRFGPATRQGIKDQAVLETGDRDSTRHFVRLFQAALRLNQRKVSFDGNFTDQVAGATAAFQRFAALEPVNGDADYKTWAELLTSTGDDTRHGTACDTSTEVTAARGEALKAAGYAVVGRYLTNVPHSMDNKKLQPGELKTLTEAGLKVFPVFETFADSRPYFTEAQGVADALASLDAARQYGFGRETTVYFAVDFDAVDADVEERVIPYFKGLSRRLGCYGSPFTIGVYGPRHVCARLAAEGLTHASFVADLSTGWSGNAGYPLPGNWTFNQISTLEVGSGGGHIEIDNDISSGRDHGQGEFHPPSPDDPKLDVRFDGGKQGALLHDVRAYLESLGVYDIPGRYVNFTEHSLNKTLEYDELITGLARALRMRKSLIQCPIFWEIRKLTPFDGLADGLVLSYYSWKEQVEAWEKLPTWEKVLTPYPQFPAGARDDASTGLGQIFAATAIRARNFAVDHGIIKGSKLNGKDWHDVGPVWRRLHSDNEYNICTVPLVLIEGADEVGVHTDRLRYSEDDTRRVLARYNGVGEGAEEYGRQLLGLYKVFEKYNAPAR